MTFWGEVHTNGNPQVGIFGGIYLQHGNQGRHDRSAESCLWTGQPTSRSLLPDCPKVIYNAGKVRLALEMEYTNAAYGSDYDAILHPSEQPQWPVT